MNQIPNVNWPGRENYKLSSGESTASLVSDIRDDSGFAKEQPLFLQLSCSVHSRNSLSSTPVKFLPTCFSEIIKSLNDYDEQANPLDLKVSLDIICLYLSKEVLEINLERTPGVRATSYCSASPVGSFRTESESSPANEPETIPLQRKMLHLPLYQHNAVTSLKEEIEWLLQDETVTALLDQTTPNEETLLFVAKHVSSSNERPSCYTEKVPLQFVNPSQSSSLKFLEELKKLEVDKYCIQQEGELFYFVKNAEKLEIPTDLNSTKDKSADVHETEEGNN